LRGSADIRNHQGSVLALGVGPGQALGAVRQPSEVCIGPPSPRATRQPAGGAEIRSAAVRRSHARRPPYSAPRLWAGPSGWWVSVYRGRFAAHQKRIGIRGLFDLLPVVGHVHGWTRERQWRRFPSRRRSGVFAAFASAFAVSSEYRLRLW